MAGTILYEDDEIRVVRRPGASDFTLVTFGPLNAIRDVRQFWGEWPAEKLDLDVVGFVCKGDTWYPASAMARTAPLVRGSLKSVAIGYGFSMGGYGALKYGRLLGLTHAVALSPQLSIDPADVPEDLRYRRSYRPDMHAGMRVAAADLPPWSVMVLDPRYALDRAQADIAPAVANLVRLHYGFLGHGTVDMLTGTTILAEFFERVRRRDMPGLLSYLRGLRGCSPQWFRLVGRANAIRGRWGRANRLWHRAVALGLPAETIARERAMILAEGNKSSGELMRPVDAAWRITRVNEQVKRQAAVGAWREAAHAASKLNPATADPGAVTKALEAAIALREDAALVTATRLAIAADLPPPLRAACAGRLVRAGYPALGLQVLVADPAMLAEDTGRDGVIASLEQIAAAPAADAGLRVTARHMIRRLLGSVPEEREPSRFRFPGLARNGTPELSGPEVVVHTSSGGDPRLRAEAMRALSGFAASAEEARPPAVWRLSDVYVNRNGQIWDAQCRLFRAMGRSLPKESRQAMASAPEIGRAALAVEPRHDMRGWMVNYLPSLAWRLDGEGGDLPLLVGDALADFVTESLALCAEEGAPRMVPVGYALRVRQLYFGDQTIAQFAHRSAMAGVLARVALRIGGVPVDAAPICLVSGRVAEQGFLERPGLRAMLAERGFRVLTTDGLSLRDQLRAFNAAPAIVAFDGAALAPLVLAAAPRRVFEVIRARPGTVAGKLALAKFSRIRGHRHQVWLEPPAEEVGRAPNSPADLLAAIDRFLAG